VHRFSAFVSTRGKHEVKQSDREDISNMNSAYLVPKFTLWCAEVATTIINTGQPPPPVSTQGPPHDNTRPTRAQGKTLVLFT